MTTITYIRHNGQRCVRTIREGVGETDVTDFERSMGFRIRFPWETSRDADMRELCSEVGIEISK